MRRFSLSDRTNISNRQSKVDKYERDLSAKQQQVKERMADLEKKEKDLAARVQKVLRKEESLAQKEKLIQERLQDLSQQSRIQENEQFQGKQASVWFPSWLTPLLMPIFQSASVSSWARYQSIIFSTASVSLYHL